MDKSFERKNIYVIIFEIIIISLAVGGITYATSQFISGRTQTILIAGIYEIDYQGSFAVTGSDLEPISDSLININTTESVLRAEFSIKGTEKNTEDLIYDIMLKDMNIDCSLLNEYTKWNLYKNGTLLSQGNLSPQFDSNVVTENLTLTTIQEDLPKHNEGYDNYVLIIWISEACDDLTTCTFVDQTPVVNSRMSMTAFVAVNNTGKQELVRTSSADYSCANAPELYDSLLPVYYDEGIWKIADKNNGATNPWYDYHSAKWANAIITDNKAYYSQEPGTHVKEEDIVAALVWIPRFKYLTWNVEDNLTDSYDAYRKGITISFEGGLSTSKPDDCTEEECPLKNNQYLTHPVFGDNLRGFWISKYEINDNNNITFTSNRKALINEDITTYEEKINSFVNKYQLNATSTIINNLEWGAVTYLSHSQFGLCPDNNCLELESNATITSGHDKQDTTTRNVYGVYDMSGSASEYVIGSHLLGAALQEVLIDESHAWYNSSYTNNQKDYLLRGGIDKTIFTVDDLGMFDTTTRMTIKKKV